MDILDICDFAEQIKVEFGWIMYNTIYYEIDDPSVPLRLTYPYCCQLASQLFASYVDVHTDHKILCLSAKGGCMGHYWCLIDNKVIDFTLFQFNLHPNVSQKFKEYKWERNDFYDYVKAIPVVYEVTSHPFMTSPVAQIHTEKLLAKSIALGYNFSISEFYEYVRDAIPQIQQKMFYR